MGRYADTVPSYIGAWAPVGFGSEGVLEPAPRGYWGPTVPQTLGVVALFTVSEVLCISILSPDNCGLVATPLTLYRVPSCSSPWHPQLGGGWGAAPRAQVEGTQRPGSRASVFVPCVHTVDTAHFPMRNWAPGHLHHSHFRGDASPPASQEAFSPPPASSSCCDDVLSKSPHLPHLAVSCLYVFSCLTSHKP